MASSGVDEEQVRLLVADSDPAVVELLRRTLERRSFTVDALEEPLELAAHLAISTADIAVAQVGGPLQLRPLQDLRDEAGLARVRVLAMLPPGDENEVATVLDEGADDCMVKPISPRELVARVGAMARRLDRPAPTLRFDGLAIDIRGRQVTVDERQIELPPREFDLLVYLAMRPNEVVPRERLLAAVWNQPSDWSHPDDTLTEHVHRLRRRIETDADRPRWVQTARGVGYRFNPSG